MTSGLPDSPSVSLPSSTEAATELEILGVPLDSAQTNSSTSAASAFKHFLVIGDQSVVSGSNFITSIALARGLSLEEFGQYSLIWMSVLFGINIQLSSIIAPMMSVGPLQRRLSQSTYIGCVTVHQMFFTGASTLLLGNLLLFLSYAAGILPAALIWPLLFANAAYQLQDFARRVLFYLNKSVAALLNDCISYLGQLAIIAFYFFRHSLTVGNALWITGLTSAAALIVALPLLPRPVFAPALLRIVFRRNWKSARYLVGATFLQWTSGNLFILVSPFFLGAIAAGVMRACQSVTNMTNIWFQGLENSLPSEASSTLRTSGAAGLRHYILRSLSILGLATAVVVLVVAAAPEFWLRIIYGSHLQGYGYVLRAYALLSLGIVLTLPLRAGLRAMEDTSPILWGYIVTSIYSLISAPLLAKLFGLPGVAWGVVGTQLILIPILLLALRKRLRHG
jgi:O-antigen/teichoic acid export membrane protein